MTMKWFLPPLAPNNEVPVANEKATWIQLPSLMNLSKGMQTVKTVQREKIKSAPQVWGHIRVFETALFEPTHVAHTSALNEWYGLLTALALRSTDGMRLTSKMVSLEPEAGNITPANRKFLKILNDTKPTGTLGRASVWRDVCLLQVNVENNSRTVTIGMLSPTTLVVPSRSFRGDPALPQFWLRNGISNPLAQEQRPLTNDQKAVCKIFADEMAAEIRMHENDLITDRLIKLLNDYSALLQSGGAANAIADPLPADDDLVPEPAMGSIFAALNKSWRIGEPSTSVSDCRIQLEASSELRNVFSEALLIDPAIAGKLGRNPDQVAVLNGRMLSQLNSEAEVARFKREARALSWKGNAQVRIPEENATGILALTPQDIFSDYFVPLYSPQTADGSKPTMISAHSASCQTFLLPIKPAALLLGDASFFNSRLEITPEPNGRAYVARLSLDLIDRTGRVVKHKIERRYRAPGEKGSTSDGWVVISSAGRGGVARHVYPTRNLQVWPNFKAPGWTWNYLLCRGHSEDQARVTTGSSGKIIAKDLCQLAGAEARWQRLETWASPQGPWPEVGSVARAGNEPDGAIWMETLDFMRPAPDQKRYDLERHQRSDLSFEAACFSVAADLFNADLPREVYAGIAFFPPCEGVAVDERPATIAVDFGTTNTTVYWQRGDMAPTPINFQPRIRRLNENESREESTLPTAFFPPFQSVSQPFPTVVQQTAFTDLNMDREALVKPWGKTLPVPWSKHAYLLKDVSALIGAIFGTRRSGVPRFGFKFAAEGETTELVENFLGHLFLLCYAEMVVEKIPPSRVSWKFSYPLALQRPDNYQKMLEESIQKIFPKAKLSFASESDAALGYFLLYGSKDSAVNTRRGVFKGIILDIGGGTTDIYVYGQGPFWQQSVKFAGTQLMVQWLLHNSSALDKLNLLGPNGGIFDGPDEIKYLEACRQSHMIKPEAIDAAGVIVNSPRFAENFNANFYRKADEIEFRKLRAGAGLMLGGLLYYISVQLKAMQNSAKKSGGPKVDFRQLSGAKICFAGRGASFFSSQRGDPIFSKIANACLTTDPDGGAIPRGGATFDSFVFSDDPKSEAVLGMLLMGEQAVSFGGPDPVNSTLSAGVGFEITNGRFNHETHILEQTKIQPTDFMDSISPADLERVTEIDMANFEQFLEQLKSGGLEIVLNDKAIAKLREDATQVIEEAVRGNDSKVERANPPFVELIVSTLRLLYKGEVEFRFT